MTIREEKIKGLFEIQLEPKFDSRGFFMRTYDGKIFKKLGLKTKWVQESHPFSKKKGTIRGIHFQYPPFAETKLIRCVGGKILFTIVDLRAQPKTFGTWVQIVVSAKKKNMIYVPAGCGVCMCALTNSCHIFYKIDNYFSPDHYDSIKWDDPDLAIKFPIKKPTEISEKDANAPSFKQFLKKNARGIKIK